MKPALKKKVAKTADCDISVEDIDMLPWNKSGTRVDMQQLLLRISMLSAAGSYPDSGSYPESESTDMTESFGDDSFSGGEVSESEATDEETLTEAKIAKKEGKTNVDTNETLKSPIEKVAALIYGVFDPDPAVVQSTLDSLQKFIDEDLAIEDKSLRTFERLFVAAGGCEDYVVLLKEQLSTVTYSLPMSTLIPDFAEIDDAETAAELKI